MARNDNPLSIQLDRDLADLKLLEIAQHYREVLDDAARKGSSMLEVLATLIGKEQAVRQQRALERRLRQAWSAEARADHAQALARFRARQDAGFSTTATA